MNKLAFEYISWCSSYIVALPLIVLLFNSARLNRLQKILGLLLIADLLTEIGTHVLWSNGLNNLFVYHIYAVIEFVLIATIYSFWLPDVFGKSRLLALTVSFTLFGVINVAFFQDLYTFNSNSTSLSAILICLFALITFYRRLTQSEKTVQLNTPEFWLNAGFLLYFSSSLILFLFSNLLNLSPKESYSIWGLHALINIILHLFYARALWIVRKTD